jgi:hypothetical protein
MQPTIENTIETTEAPPQIPPVECAPWCCDGSGHAGAIHPDDQYCISEGARVMLTAEKLVEYDKGVYGLGQVDVYASREAYSIRPLVKVVHNEDGREGSITLTTGEARELVSALSVIVEAVEGS